MSDMPDFLNRLDAWQKAGQNPERTSSFLRDDTAPTADEVDKVNPAFGQDAKVATNTSNTVNPANEGPQVTPTPTDHMVVKTPVDKGDDEVDPPQPVKKAEDPLPECGCPVSAALNSMKEEAEAADLYNKRANMVDDEHAREVYRDIAKEEMVHLGEAAELLSEADPELAKEVPKGMEEAKGQGEPTEEEKPDIDKAIADRQ